MRYTVEPRGSGFEVIDTLTPTQCIVFESLSKPACVWRARKLNSTLSQQPNSRAALARAEAETA